MNPILPVQSWLAANTLRSVLHAMLLASVLAVVSTLLQAQSYPLRPVKIVVPFPPGGSSDAVARVLGERLSEEWKQPVLIENRPGAGTTIAGAYVAAAAADGYTLFLQGVATYATTGSLYRNLAFDPLKGFAPVSMLSVSPFILVTRNGLGVNSAKELAELARSKPGALSYGSSGSGGSPHLFAEMMARSTGTRFLHVPFKGLAPAVMAALSGDVDFLVADVAVMPQVRAGKLKALAVSTARQTTLAAGIPTMAESGLPGLVMPSAIAMLTTAGTPREVISAINAQINRVLANNDVRQKLIAQGFEPSGSTPEELASLLTEEVRRLSAVIREVGVKLD